MHNSFGILEPQDYFQPPGTSRLQTVQQQSVELHEICKTGKGKHKNTILVPRPSDDPNDPLNWSIFEKRIVLWFVALASALVHAIGPSFSTSYDAIAHDFHKSIDRVVQTVSGNYSLTAGFGAVMVTAFSICYGKRLTFILSTLTLALLSAWLVLEQSFSTFAVARALQGFASAPLEVLAAGLVSDLFFVHERGTALSIIGFLMTGFTLLSQIAGGFVVEYLGWRKLFLGQSILMAVVSIFLFFSVAETNWPRPREIVPRRNSRTVTAEVHKMQDLQASSSVVYPGDSSYIDTGKIVSIASKDQQLELSESEIKANSRTTASDMESYHNRSSKDCAESTAARTSYLCRLSLWHGKSPDGSFWTSCFRPLPLLCHPAVLFGVFVHGLGSTWLHAFGFAKLALFSKPPYNLTPSQIGLTVVPGAISGVLGQLIAGYFIDDIVKRMARQNKGIYEAEFRLLLMIPQTIASLVGFLGFGLSIGHGRPLWLVLFFYACVTFSIPFGSLASLSYLVDSLPQRNQEALVSTIFVKSIFILVFASLINGWITSYGPQKVFVCLGLVNFGISCCTVPFYIFGKRLRAAMVQSSILQRLDNPFHTSRNRTITQHKQ